MNFSEDCSLFIALTTAPLGKVEEQLKEIRALFRGYKEKQDDISNPIENRVNNKSIAEQEANEAFKAFFYEPSIYYMFGDYDLAILSLVDDFTLSNRNFHPYSYFVKNKLGPDYRAQNFRYQIITGTTPFIPNEEETKQYYTNRDEHNFPRPSRLIDKAKNTFLEKGVGQLRFPFIGITRIKLNNGLLVGSGAQFVGFIEMALLKILRKEQERGKNRDRPIAFDFIITESFSWHELSLTLFCNDYKFMSDIIVGLRELSLLDVAAQLCPLFKRELEEELKLKGNEPLNTQKILDAAHQKAKTGSIEKEILYQLDLIWSRSLTQYWIKQDQPKLAEDMDVGQTHVFVKTFTSFGYDPLLLGDLKAESPRFKFPGFFEPYLTKEETRLLGRWHVKPGHAKYVLQFHQHITDKIDGLVESEAKKTLKPYFFVAGDSDFIFADSIDDLKQTWLAAHFYKDSTKQSSPSQNIAQHSRRINTLPKIGYDQSELNEVFNRYKVENSSRPSQHYYSSKRLESIAFSLSELDEIREWLYQCKVSKILLEKVLHMFVNYNDGVQDPLLFIYFIELRGFMEEVRDFIHEQAEPNKFVSKPDSEEQDLKDLHDALDELVMMFDKAFTNRFHQSYITAAITDYNMEYNGGCQQILSALDALYKVSSGVFGENRDHTSFAYVMGLTDTKSNMYSLRLNYFHIFQPSMLLSLITKEASNFFEAKNLYSIGNGVEDLPTTRQIDDYLDAFSSERELMVIRDIMEVCKSVSTEEMQQIISKYLHFFEVGEYIGGEQVLCDLLGYLKADILNYLYTYNLDSDLFFYWYFNTWIETSFMHDRDGINEKNFLFFTARVIFVLEYIDAAYLDDLENNNIAPSKQLEPLWNRHFKPLRRFAQFLLKSSSELLDRLKAIKVQAAIITTQDVARPFLQEIKGAKELENLFKEIKHYNNEPPSDKLTKKVNAFTKDISAIILSQSARHRTCLALKLTYTDTMFDRIVQRIERGELNVFQHSNLQSSSQSKYYLKNNVSFFVHALMYAYLKSLKQFNEDEDGKLIHNPVLFRNSYNGEIETFPDLHDEASLRFLLGGLLFDPMGGIFTASKLLKRKHLRMRSTLMRSLWDMSLKFKMKLFKDLPVNEN